MIIYLTIEEIIHMHDAFINKFGGLPGIHSKTLLLSAIEMPKATMFGEDLHKSLYDKASAYLYHLVQNHPFKDGNKRTAFGATIAFLKLNDVPILFNAKAFEELVIATAQGQKTKEQISYFLEKSHDE